MKIGFFGGSFNPPHLGHLLAATYALKTFDLDEIWLAPIFHHPFGKNVIAFEHRFKMCQLLVQELNPPFRVSDIEQDLDHGGKTYFTLKHLQEKHPNDAFSLVIGSDLKDQLQDWFESEKLQKEFDIHFVPRGQEDHPASIPNISSTNIRGHIYDENILKNVVTPEIHAYMQSHQFYNK